MPKVIDVVNDVTGRRVTYVGLPPAECIRNAWEQYTKNNFQTWNYKDPDTYGIYEDDYAWYLGDWRIDKNDN